jgi:hypothetical protein
LLVDIERGWVGLLLLGTQQAVRLAGAGRLSWRTDLDLLWPAIGLGGMAVAGFLVSSRPDLSYPKLLGILLGVAVYSATISTLQRVPPREYPRLVLTAKTVYLVLGAVLAVVAMLFSAPREYWKGSFGVSHPIQLPMPNDADLWRPSLPAELRSSHGLRAPVHPNELAGTLTLFLPVGVALLVHRPWRALEVGKRPSESSGWWRPRVAQMLTAVPWIACGIMSLVLALTLSRGGLLAVLLTTAIILVARSRRIRPELVWGAPVAVVLGSGVLALLLVIENTIDEQALAAAPLARLLMLGRPDDLFDNLRVRLDLWRVLLELLSIYPWTGIGLNTLPTYFQGASSPFSQRLRLPLDSHLFPHAHNLFLHTALDLGLPGLVFLLILLGIAGRRLWRGLEQLGGTPCEVVVVGVAAALLAHLLFSLTDAITLGAKPSVFLWLLLGVAVSLPSLCAVRTGREIAGGP